MVRLVGRRLVPFVLGVGIWLLSLPLVTAHAPRSLPAVPGTATLGAATTRIPATRIFHAVRPNLTVGQLVTPSPDVQAPAAAPPSTPTITIGANWLYIPRLGLSQPVGWYSDCLGSAPVPRWGTWRWSCAGSNNTYIMAHNPGVFTPILGLHAGDVIDYGDPHGVVHSYRVTMTTIVANTELWPLNGLARPSITLQTCWTWDGTRDLIIRAIQV